MQLNQIFKQHFNLAKISLNKKHVMHIDPKTHTLNKSNQFLYFKNKSRQFSEHTLTHVNLVMAKSHYTYTLYLRKTMLKLPKITI